MKYGWAVSRLAFCRILSISVYAVKIEKEKNREKTNTDRTSPNAFDFSIEVQQEGQHPLTAQRAANDRLSFL